MSDAKENDLNENAEEQNPAEAAEATTATEEVGTQDGATDAEVTDFPSEEIKELTIEEQLDAANAKAEENYNSYLRSVADLDTYRRRVNREKDDLRKFAIAGLLEQMLPVYDNLSLGMASADADPKVVVQGLQMVVTQFKSTLEENGIEEIDPKPGDEFDHNQHDAMQTAPSADIEEGKIVQLVRKGFSLNGRLIRPAAVIVSGGPEGAGA